MRSPITKKILKRTPKATELYVEKYASLVVLIKQIIKDKGLTSKELAENMDKSPSEISKWFSGDHNFTLKSICKLESELGETLLHIPQIKQFKTVSTKEVHLTVRTFDTPDYEGEFKPVKVKSSQNYGKAS